MRPCPRESRALTASAPSRPRTSAALPASGDPNLRIHSRTETARTYASTRTSAATLKQT